MSTNYHLFYSKIQKAKMSNHFVEPEYYLVSYWPGVTPSDNITTIRTESMQALIVYSELILKKEEIYD